MSVDVEEWHQGEFLRRRIDGPPQTDVVQSILEILDLFDTYKTKATFFIVGETLRRYPECGKHILEANHELGYHGWDHRPLSELTPQEFIRSLSKFQEILNKWDYQPVAFRAPSASLDNRSLWIFRHLSDAGYLYDSSIFPYPTPLYGVFGAPIFPYWPSRSDIAFPTMPHESWGLLEFPFLTFGPKQLRIPLGTGFYLRLFPLYFYKWALNKRERQKIPATISFHSWEYTSDVPSDTSSLTQKLYLRHGLGYCKSRVKSLVQNYSFTSISEIGQKLK